MAAPAATVLTPLAHNTVLRKCNEFFEYNYIALHKIFMNQIFLMFVLCFSGAQALADAYFGNGTGPILLDYVRCYGYETTLLDCYNDGIRIPNCAHSKAASVRCQGIFSC